MDLNGLTEAVDFLKATGPVGLAVIAGWWAYRKDKEKNTVQEQAAAAAKANYEQLVALVASQTAALVKMESTIEVLKDVIGAVMERKHK